MPMYNILNGYFHLSTRDDGGIVLTYHKMHISYLTLNLTNFLNGIIHLTFFGTVRHHFWDIKL